MNNKNILCVIPARYASKRFPGKPLADILGKPMIQWVYERAQQANLISETIVATDDDRIFQAVKNFGGVAEKTSSDIKNGTERVAVISAKYDYPIVVNLQGDEPLIDPKAIDIAIRTLSEDESAVIGTLIKKIENITELDNPNLPKVVIDKNNNALYFSRSIIPYDRDLQQQQNRLPYTNYYRHIGLYVYRKEFLQTYIKLPESQLERMEKLEQLRVLEYGYSIKTAVVDYAPRGVDTPEDLESLVQYLKENRIE